ncbi:MULTISPECIES: helix-turn-helix transcriptional regulator [Streptomyces]|uniref:helix-turn-helix transcriptional regulator n=1 Tax=Streptomyces TaxID=1883 RepID=UPI00073DCDA2|nr:LuxR C-terminal-related transcriptional regulator [Streptomyces sp. FBKL.4005]MYU30154.1 LuxR family transcriptional regulator [Streptomyces sp. SID7810]OYP15279.1 LuxR family transcriptional regulator [Streptomyces sp. FBKL.4005]CUW31222.1 transcriptional regulator NarL [Streptomyces reticuli]
MQAAQNPPQGGQSTDSEAKAAYVALVERIARSGARDAAEKEELGGLSAELTRWLAERRLLDPDGERLTPPERALHRIASEHRRRLRETVEGLSRDARAIEDVLSLLAVPRLDAREAVETEYFTDRAHTRERLAELDALSREEFLAMRNSFPEAQVLEASLVRDLEMVANGVRMRVLTSQQALRSPAPARYLHALTDAGAEVRVAATVPLHMNIVDRAIVVLGAGPGPQGEGGDVILHSTPVARCFVRIFTHAWDLARPHTERHAGRGGAGCELTAQEREVLALLATGAKDETIARRLACSDRTLRRLMNQIMEKLGTSSRFEAGVTAARLGLVD